MSSTSPDERTAKARILEAAIRCFAQLGPADTTARRVAETASVSAGLVMHHFGSMEGLRSACDAYVAGRIRELKENAASAGPNLDVLGLLRESEAGHLLAYLAKILTEDSPAVAQLVNGLVADAEGYLRQFEEAGMVRPSENPRARAVLLVIWSLGALTMHKHLERLLGVDLVDPDLTAKPEFARYALPVYEVYGGGVMTEDFTAKAQAAFADALEGESA